ncbi:MAG: hypothetical protein M3R47_19940 [Chloroflexota bacterium]|nr:hypothetical protein [Chloroflexota bacterium]
MTEPTKTIEELLAMSSQARGQYLQALPEAERVRVAQELWKRQADRDVQKMVDSLNRNVLMEHILEMPGMDLRKCLEVLPLETLRELFDNLNRNSLKNSTDEEKP